MHKSSFCCLGHILPCCYLYVPGLERRRCWSLKLSDLQVQERSVAQLDLSFCSYGPVTVRLALQRLAGIQSNLLLKPEHILLSFAVRIEIVLVCDCVLAVLVEDVFLDSLHALHFLNGFCLRPGARLQQTDLVALNFFKADEPCQSHQYHISVANSLGPRALPSRSSRFQSCSASVALQPTIFRNSFRPSGLCCSASFIARLYGELSVGYPTVIL